jgi:hypothetical protein
LRVRTVYIVGLVDIRILTSVYFLQLLDVTEHTVMEKTNTELLPPAAKKKQSCLSKFFVCVISAAVKDSVLVMTAISSEAATNSAAAVLGEVEESQTADLTAEDRLRNHGLLALKIRHC